MSHGYITRRGASGGSGRGTPIFTYTGDFELVNDIGETIPQGDKTIPNWKLRLLTSGTLSFSRLGSAKAAGADVFLVGGGGNGGSSGGGAGGYTDTESGVEIPLDTQCTVAVGEATGTSSLAINALTLSALGGGSGDGAYGGNGGSGGGFGANQATTDFFGGADGGNGYGSDATHGLGQGTTTREFGAADGTLYSGGGGGYRMGTGGAGGGGNAAPYGGTGTDGQANTGGGGGGGNAAGGSGIVILRNHRV